jgi:BON domain-containing protein
MPMPTLMILIVIAGLLFTGCEKGNKRITAEPVQPTDQRRTLPNPSATPEHPKKPPVSPPRERRHEEQMTAVPASKREEDASKQAELVTPLSQSESEADVAVTQRIRQALLREDLSFAAKNVLVITDAKHVVLKGQVRSQSEAERIKGIAATMTTKKIEDVLEVTP